MAKHLARLESLESLILEPMLQNEQLRSANIRLIDTVARLTQQNTSLKEKIKKNGGMTEEAQQVAQNMPQIEHAEQISNLKLQIQNLLAEKMQFMHKSRAEQEALKNKMARFMDQSRRQEDAYVAKMNTLLRQQKLQAEKIEKLLSKLQRSESDYKLAAEENKFLDGELQKLKNQRDAFEEQLNDAHDSIAQGKRREAAALEQMSVLRDKICVQSVSVESTMNDYNCADQEKSQEVGADSAAAAVKMEFEHLQGEIDAITTELVKMSICVMQAKQDASFADGRATTAEAANQEQSLSVATLSRKTCKLEEELARSVQENQQLASRMRQLEIFRGDGSKKTVEEGDEHGTGRTSAANHKGSDFDQFVTLKREIADLRAANHTLQKQVAARPSANRTKSHSNDKLVKACESSHPTFGRRKTLPVSSSSMVARMPSVARFGRIK